MKIHRDYFEEGLPCSSVHRNNNNPYYIVTPDYTHKSSGIRVLHELCSILNQFGYEAYVISGKVNGDLWTPRLTEETKAAHYIAKKTPIVIYPEVVVGTPINIGVPIRYVLNYPGLVGGEKIFGKNETIFCYLKEYYPLGEQMFLPTIDISQIDKTEPQKHRQKGSSAFYFNRNKPSDELIESLGKDSIEISNRKHYPYSDMIAILKSVEILYCFESSAIVTEALLCGCAVIFIQNGDFNKIPNVACRLGLDGIAWGNDPDDVEKAISTVYKKREQIIKSYSCWIDNLKKFIEITQKISLEKDITESWPQQIVDALSLPGLSSKDHAARQDRKKYNKVNQQFKEWQQKITLREVDADIYAEYISKGDLPAITVVIHHEKDSNQVLIANTIDSLEVNFLKPCNVVVISENDPPVGFESSSELSWIKKKSIECTLNTFDCALWVLIVESGVRLAPNALVEMAISAKSKPDSILFYGDEDIYSEDGVHYYPGFKPDFNIELIRCTNYIGGSVLFNKSRWFNAGLPTAVHEIYDFLISCSLTNDARRVCHVDGMLFHGTGQVSSITENLEFEVAQKNLGRSGLVKAVKPMDRLGSWLVEYKSVENKNTTLVVPTGVQPGYMRQMLDSLVRHKCPNLVKIILVCNEFDYDEVDFALRDLEYETQIEIITYKASQYNHGHALNIAISKVTTEYVWVCDDDIEFVRNDTLGTLLSVARQEDVACVEPRLISIQDSDARLVNGPVILGINGSYASYTGELQFPDEYGYFSRLQLNQDVSAVSGNCFVFKISQWQQVGGFDTDKFGLRFTVLDFCLKLNCLGYRHVWAPLANAMHQGGRSLQKRLGDFQFKIAYANNEINEKNNLLELWGNTLANDRFYNRHLSLITPYDVESNIVIDWKPHRKERRRLLASPLSSGAGQYRVVEPLEMLQDHGFVQSSVILPNADRKTRVLQPIELIRARPDTLVLQHSVDDAHLLLIDQYKKALPDIHILQMVDDLLGFVPEKHPNRRFQTREGHTRMVEALKKSDSMVVTTEPLKEHYKRYIDNIKIIPNCLAKNWFALVPAKTKRSRLRVGWIGAGQHKGDLEIINNVVKILSDRVDWVFMGMQTDEAKTYIKEFHPFVSIKEYPKKMASLDLDIAVAPLEDNLFNQCKSNLRLLEYGAMSWPVVCSDVLTYRTNNPPVIRVKSTVSDWLAALNRLIDDEQERYRLGRDLHSWVVSNYTLENFSNKWQEALFPDY